MLIEAMQILAAQKMNVQNLNVQNLAGWQYLYFGEVTASLCSYQDGQKIVLAACTL